MLCRKQQPTLHQFAKLAIKKEIKEKSTTNSNEKIHLTSLSHLSYKFVLLPAIGGLTIRIWYRCMSCTCYLLA